MLALGYIYNESHIRLKYIHPLDIIASGMFNFFAVTESFFVIVHALESQGFPAQTS